MNNLNNKFSEIDEKDLATINAGNWGIVLGLIAVYDGFSDFGKGFVKGVIKPR